MMKAMNHYNEIFRDAVGFLELNSIAKGIEAADIMLKAAEIHLVMTKAGCPGRYCILFTGEVAAVRSSLEAGKTFAEKMHVGSCIIPRVHPQVVHILHQNRIGKLSGALGVMEFSNITSSLYAADAAAKAADITLGTIRLGDRLAGKSYVTLTGDVAAVRAAVEAGLSAENAADHVFSSAIMANPQPELLEMLTKGGMFHGIF